MICDSKGMVVWLGRHIRKTEARVSIGELRWEQKSPGEQQGKSSLTNYMSIVKAGLCDPLHRVGVMVEVSEKLP